MKLRALLTKTHKDGEQRMDELLKESGLEFKNLKFATIPKLLKMAHICGLWAAVEGFVRQREDELRSTGRDENAAVDAPAKASAIRSLVPLDASANSRVAAHNNAIDWRPPMMTAEREQMTMRPPMTAEREQMTMRHKGPQMTTKRDTEGKIISIEYE
eukprot:GHVU01163368.1.p1 GENE.GHVU01163368.1~~GHVU01163368.1.p1  ORF type:complete len:158 (-),score=26.24 GHVU01163368.1:18-491(-)